MLLCGEMVGVGLGSGMDSDGGIVVSPWAGDGFGGKEEISSKMDLRLGG